MVAGDAASTERLTSAKIFLSYRGMVRNRGQYRARFSAGTGMMGEIEQLSLLIGDIYDASLDQALWPDAFNRIRDFLGGCTASLVTHDAVSKAEDVHFMLGHEGQFMEMYTEKYFKINPK